MKKAARESITRTRLMPAAGVNRGISSNSPPEASTLMLQEDVIAIPVTSKPRVKRYFSLSVLQTGPVKVKE
jgi:hypothetical protein